MVDVTDTASARAMRALGPLLPLLRQWFRRELASGVTPEEAARAMGEVFAHAAAGIASETPQIETEVVDWLTWEIREQALGLLEEHGQQWGRR